MKKMLRLGALMLSAVLFCALGKAQNYKSYKADTIPYIWEDFTTTAQTELLALAGEDEVYPIQIPFPFRYFDSTYTTAYVAINGNISFGRTYAQSDFNREKLCNPVAQLYSPAGEQTTLNPDNFIAVFWDDLFIQPLCTPTDGRPQLAYRTIGTAPNRQLIVIWQNAIGSGDVDACATDPLFGATVTVEARLYEGTNVIEVHIKKNLKLDQGATIAVENLDGTYASYISCGTSSAPSSLSGFRFTPSLLAPNSGGSTKTYCAATAEDCPGAISYIRNVQLADLSNRTNDCSPMGYVDFTNIPPANLTSGQSYLLTVNSQSINNPGYVTRAWIDWNNDTIFDATTELIQLAGTSSGAATGEGIFTANITAPQGTLPGVKRMRIRHAFVANSLEPCGASARGEVEDYNLALDVPRTSYCPAQGGNCNAVPITPNDSDYIVSATIQSVGGNIVNNSGCNGGYGDFTQNAALRATWNTGTPYTVTLTRLVKSYVFAKNAAFIDWNNDFDFDDAGEKINGVANPAGDVTFAIVIPQGTTLGLKRMRLRTTSSQAGMAEPCGTQLLGEVEDYTVFVNSATAPLPGCVSTTVPANNALETCTNITLKWNKVTTATGYKVSIGTNNPYTALISDSLVSDTILVLPAELLVNTKYRWAVTPVNANGAAVSCDSLYFTTATEYDPILEILPIDDTVIVCQNSLFQLDANVSFGLPPLTYSWNGLKNNYLGDTSLVNPLFDAIELGVFSYGLTAFASNSCRSNTDSVHLKVVENAIGGTLTAAKSTVCFESLAQLNLQDFVGNVSWESSSDGLSYSSDNTISTIAANTYLTGKITAKRFFRALVEAGDCSVFSNAIEINVNPLPASPLIALVGSNPGCANELTALVSSYATGNKWNDVLATQNDTLVIAASGTYFVTYTDANGCSKASSSSSIVINPAPAKPVISITGPTPLCDGDVLTLTSSTGVVKWNDALQTVAASLVVKTNGDYFALNTDANGCKTSSNPLNIFFNNRPSKPTITKIDAKTLASTNVGTSYQWIGVNGAIAGATMQNYQPALSGTYKVVAFNAVGCSSDTSDAFVFEKIGIQELSKHGIKLYPNPSKEEFFVELANAEATLVLYDLSGRTVYTQILSTGKQTIKPNLAAGTYILKIFNADFVESTSIYFGAE